MNFDKLVARAQKILLEPRNEWSVIAGESSTTGDIYRNYLLYLAALPALAGFIKGSLIGTSVPFLGTMRVGVFAGLGAMLIGYAMSLAMIYVVALVIDWLAPYFKAQKDPLQALKTIAYSYTAVMIASIAQVLPWIGGLVMLGGGIYSIRLLYLALPVTMKCPQESAVKYTAATILAAMILGWVVALTVGGIGGGLGAGSGPGIAGSSSVEFDKDSPMGNLQDWTAKMETAERKMRDAQESGDSAAQQEALGDLMGAALGGGKVEALAPERLREFLPASIAGRERSEVTAERSGAMGLQVSSAQAHYADSDGRGLQLHITDTGSVRGITALAGWANIEQEQETDSGYERTFKEGGRMTRESWNRESQYGERSVVIGDRFTVTLSGTVGDADELADALGQVDLDGLEELRGEGVTED
ncbi:MAG: YIP1 family protein [Gammaproteobacteria bacterium]|nr:YIP1 family protein [Gammaproteobacteria bacterium]